MKIFTPLLVALFFVISKDLFLPTLAGGPTPTDGGGREQREAQREIKEAREILDKEVKSSGEYHGAVNSEKYHLDLGGGGINKFDFNSTLHFEGLEGIHGHLREGFSNLEKLNGSKLDLSSDLKNFSIGLKTKVFGFHDQPTAQKASLNEIQDLIGLNQTPFTAPPSGAVRVIAPNGRQFGTNFRLDGASQAIDLESIALSPDLGSRVKGFTVDLPDGRTVSATLEIDSHAPKNDLPRGTLLLENAPAKSDSIDIDNAIPAEIIFSSRPSNEKPAVSLGSSKNSSKVMDLNNGIKCIENKNTGLDFRKNYSDIFSHAEKDIQEHSSSDRIQKTAPPSPTHLDLPSVNQSTKIDVTALTEFIEKQKARGDPFGWKNMTPRDLVRTWIKIFLLGDPTQIGDADDLSIKIANSIAEILTRSMESQGAFEMADLFGDIAFNLMGDDEAEIRMKERIDSILAWLPATQELKATNPELAKKFDERNAILRDGLKKKFSEIRAKFNSASIEEKAQMIAEGKRWATKKEWPERLFDWLLKDRAPQKFIEIVGNTSNVLVKASDLSRDIRDSQRMADKRTFLAIQEQIFSYVLEHKFPENYLLTMMDMKKFGLATFVTKEEYDSFIKNGGDKKLMGLTVVSNNIADKHLVEARGSVESLESLMFRPGAFQGKRIIRLNIDFDLRYGPMPIDPRFEEIMIIRSIPIHALLNPTEVPQKQ